MGLSRRRESHRDALLRTSAPTVGNGRRSSNDRSEAEAFFVTIDGAAVDPSTIPFWRFWRRYLDELASKKLTEKVFAQYETVGERLVAAYFD